MLRCVRPRSSRKNLDAERILQKEREIDAELTGPDFKLIVAPDDVNRALSKIKCGCAIDENAGECLCLQYCECTIGRRTCGADCGCSGRCQYNSFMRLPPTAERECMMGKELVAMKDIPFGGISFVYTGEVISSEKYDEKEKSRHGGGVSYALTASWKGRDIGLPGEPGKPTFVIDAMTTRAGKANHSCKPNNEVFEIWQNNKIYVVGRAFHHIVKGEAITLDYQWAETSGDDDHADICLCGEDAECRGINAVIGSSLMQQSIEFYREEIKNLDMRNANERARIAKCKKGYSQQRGRQEALNILSDTQKLKAEEGKSAMYKKGLVIAIRKEREAKFKQKEKEAERKQKPTKRSASGCYGVPESCSRRARVEQADQLNKSKATASGLERNRPKDEPRQRTGSLSYTMSTTPRISCADSERETIDISDTEDDFPDETRRRVVFGRGPRDRVKLPKAMDDDHEIGRGQRWRPPSEYRLQLEKAGKDVLPEMDIDDQMAEAAPNVHDLLTAFQKYQLPAELGFQDSLVGTVLRNILLWYKTSGRNPPDLEEVYSLYKAGQLPGGSLGFQDPAVGFILRDLLRWFKYSKLPKRPASYTQLQRYPEVSGGPRGWNNEARNSNQEGTASSSAQWVDQKLGRMNLNDMAMDSRNRRPTPSWPHVIDKQQIGYFPTYQYQKPYLVEQSNQERAHPASWGGGKWTRPGQGNFLTHIPMAIYTGPGRNKERFKELLWNGSRWVQGDPTYVGGASAAYPLPGVRKGKKPLIKRGANTVHTSPVNLSRAGTPVRPSSAPQTPRLEPPGLSVWDRLCGGRNPKPANPNQERAGYVETHSFTIGTHRGGSSAEQGPEGSGSKFGKDTPIVQWGDGLLQQHEILNIVLWENGSQGPLRRRSQKDCVRPWPGTMRWVYWLHKSFRHPTPAELQTWGKTWQGITVTKLRAAYLPGQFHASTRPSEQEVRLLMIDVLNFPAYRRLLGINVEDTVHGHLWPLVWRETGKMTRLNTNIQEMPQTAER